MSEGLALTIIAVMVIFTVLLIAWIRSAEKRLFRLGSKLILIETELMRLEAGILSLEARAEKTERKQK